MSVSTLGWFYIPAVEDFFLTSRITGYGTSARVCSLTDILCSWPGRTGCIPNWLFCIANPVTLKDTSIFIVKDICIFIEFAFLGNS